MFTTGGIGPTHDDITADCVAKAFGVPIDFDPRAVAILKERLAKTGGELNEARMRMARIPRRRRAGRTTRSRGAPGFWIGNVIVMAGVPADHAGACSTRSAPKLKTGAKLLSETIRADAKEGDVGTRARRDRQGPSRRHRSAAIRSSTRRSARNTNIVVRSRDAAEARGRPKAAVEAMLAHGASRNSRTGVPLEHR